MSTTLRAVGARRACGPAALKATVAREAPTHGPSTQHNDHGSGKHECGWQSRALVQPAMPVNRPPARVICADPLGNRTEHSASI
eukprot:scaffold20104_cov120-Isochrysis_galbana.AAC.5